MLQLRAESGNSSSALSLMGADVDRITISAYVLINIGPDIIQVALALWILSTQMGTSSISAIVLCVICAAGAIYIAKLVPVRQTKWMAAIQKRVGITSDVIGSVKGIKVAGLTNNAEKQIQALRDFELAQSTQFRKIQVISILSGRPQSCELTYRILFILMLILSQEWRPHFSFQWWCLQSMRLLRVSREETKLTWPTLSPR
jgi:hypothetical protein